MSNATPASPSSSHPPVGPTAAPVAIKPPPNGRRQRRRILAGVLVLAVLALGLGVYWFFFMRGIVFTDDARLGGHLVDIAPEQPGRLIAVEVHEGDRCAAGTVLFRLDPTVPQANLRHAEAGLASAQADLAVRQAQCAKVENGNRPEQIKAAATTLKRLEYEEKLARLNLDRADAMFKANSISQDEYDRTRTAYESAHQSREGAAENLALLRKGSRAEDIASAQAAVKLVQSKVAEAEAAVAVARGELDRCTVKAPFAGWVVRRWLNPGAMPLTAQPVVSLFDPTTLRVDANIEEQNLDGVQVGDVADVSVDAYPQLQLRGRVTRIMRATNSEFSLIPAEGVAGTFIKVSQRVPIRVSLSVPPDLPLGPGLSVEVHIHSGTAPAAQVSLAAHE